MTLAPLLALSASFAVAVPRPAGGPPAPRQDAPSIDPAVLTSEARALWEADPAGFEKEHGPDLEAQRRWSQDPSLGQAECLEAKRDPRSCMEERVRDLSGVVKPQELAVINSYVKLLPRGVSAPLPGGGSERASSAAGTPAAAPTPAAGPAPTPAPTPAPARQQGVRFNAPPPAQRTASPSAQPAVPGGSMSPDETVSWICSFVPCAKT